MLFFLEGADVVFPICARQLLRFGDLGGHAFGDNFFAFFATSMN